MFMPRLASLLCLATTVSSAYGAAAGGLAVQMSDAYTNHLDDVKVPVVLGVMSRCPDAILCETVFDRVLERVSDKIDLSLTFIGTLNASEPDFGVTCKHGPEECAGRSEIGKPEKAIQCAKTAELDWENSGVGACAGVDGSGKAEEGVRLLQQSVAITQELGIEKSCTVMINGKQVCIHDETWKECEGGHAPKDFIRQIEEEYEKLNQI
ncbi:hypothetical protein NUW54_g5532 [Trametes sanguinea]|uniref:Uncharacterized protein n=1 Tax=Trametes sanguinea TaxID=158606 RepID=A0ACC1PWP9_9APHY|nr:hypothetical protein NUW54_g5532 [Trametes sanguinea]